MANPTFTPHLTEKGEGITYDCGCPCTPTTVPALDGSAGFEHCCCGKVHFAGIDAEQALATYLAKRRASRRREPEYLTGAATVELSQGTTMVAWAFPIE